MIEKVEGYMIGKQFFKSKEEAIEYELFHNLTKAFEEYLEAKRNTLKKGSPLDLIIQKTEDASAQVAAIIIVKHWDVILQLRKEAIHKIEKLI